MRYRLVASLMLLCLAVRAQEITTRDVKTTIELLTRGLTLEQQGDGSWNYPAYPVGCTALCLLALKQAGLSNRHPAVARATTYVNKATDGKVYSEALVAVALAEVDPERYERRLKRAGGFLEVAQTDGGGWGYDDRKTRWDNSNTQFAALGLAAVERCGFRVAPQVKERARQHWLKQQKGDGTWGYSGSSSATTSMTLAGLASLNLLGVKHERKQRACGEY